MKQHREITYSFLMNASSELLVERTLRFAYLYKLVDLRNDRAVFYQDDLYNFNEFMVVDANGDISRVPCHSIPEVHRPKPRIAIISEEMDAIYMRAASIFKDGLGGRSVLANLYSHSWNILKIDDDAVYMGNPHNTDVRRVSEKGSATVPVESFLDHVPVMPFRSSDLKNCIRNYYLNKDQS